MKRKITYSGPYRVDPQPRLDFTGELSVDLFAGGGGASMGHEWATGRSPDIAVNHNPQAVLMHQVNHPHTKHFCESVFDVHPQTVCGGRPVGHLWMSPDCTHFSKAKGAKPVSKRVRGLAWVGKRWAATVRPRVIFLENVEEFQTWGPLVRINGNLHPCKKRAGRTFRNFVRELQRLGYVVEWQTMRACDYGAPTIRKRLFLVARCDGQPIVWPEPTHGAPESIGVQSGRLLPWRTAAECIDWSIPCPSIFTRKKPLAENTLRRIARGIQRYVIDNPEPFIVPFTCGVGGRAGQSRPRSVREPLQTITAKADTVVVVPTFEEWYSDTKAYGGTRKEYDKLYPQEADGPTTGGNPTLIAPSLTEHANASNQRTFSINEPLRTQCAQVKGGHFALQSAMLLKHYGGVVGHGVNQPAGTITTADHHGIASATLVRNFGKSDAASIEAPHPTILNKQKDSLVSAHMIRHFGESTGSAATNPAATVMPHGKGKTGFVASNLVKLKGTCRDGQRTNQPMPTICSGGTHIAEVRAFLLKYYGADQDPRMGEPLHTLTTKHRFGLVMVKGELYEISDIGMRMLAARELYRAQGFPDTYIIHRDAEGKPITITDQVRMVGNSVSPYNAAALIAANAGDAARWEWSVAA